MLFGFFCLCCYTIFPDAAFVFLLPSILLTSHLIRCGILRLHATTPDVPQERIAMRLSGDIKTYSWSIEGEFYPNAAPVDIPQK